MSESRRNDWAAAFVPVLLICIWGGIYDFAAALYGAVFAVILLIMIRRTGRIAVPVGMVTICLAVMLAGYAVSVFLARDKGIAFTGVIRQIPLCLFWILWNQVKDSGRAKIRRWLAAAASVLTAASVLLYAVPAARELLFREGRLGGVFQYSNTYALFLLICIVFLVSEEEKTRLRYAAIAVCVCGIVLCGSRSVMVLAVITFLVLLAGSRKDRGKLLLAAGCALAFAAALALALRLDLGRLAKLTLDSSTLNGRFLYWRDALPVIGKHPFGLGYMGYFFLQPQFQTGNYVTRFVHNDILQCALDAGLIPMLALIAVIFANIFSRRNTRQNRIILALLFLHSLFDFDLQYTLMSCIMLMCMAPAEGGSVEAGKKTAGIVTGGIALFCVYFSLALGFSHFGLNRQALTLYPPDTFARESLMREKEDRKQAEIIIESNGMLASAYDLSAVSRLKDGDYTGAREDIQGMLKCAGYDIDLYNQSVYYLSIALDQAVRREDSDEARGILEEIREVPERLKDLERRTSFFAYRIYDKPEFELSGPVQDYIQSLADISL